MVAGGEEDRQRRQFADRRERRGGDRVIHRLAIEQVTGQQHSVAPLFDGQPHRPLERLQQFPAALRGAFRWKAKSRIGGRGAQMNVGYLQEAHRKRLRHGFLRPRA